MRRREEKRVRFCLPLLDFVEAWEKGHGDGDDDGFFSVTDFDLSWRACVSGLGFDV